MILREVVRIFKVAMLGGAGVTWTMFLSVRGKDFLHDELFSWELEIEMFIIQEISLSTVLTWHSRTGSL